MSRKEHLFNALNQHLKYDKQGSFNNRKYRVFALNKIIDDLNEFRMLPPNWHSFTTEIIQQLVKHWRNGHKKDTTIMNYMVALRYLFKKINHRIEGIDNKSLGLNKQKKLHKIEIEEDYLNKIQEPIAHVLFGLQIKFGLTVNESLHIIPDVHFNEGALWITREISINHIDRIVPIETTCQQNIIGQLRQLVGSNQSLVMRFGERHVRLAYQYTFSVLGLSTRRSYRHLYAKNRYKWLCRKYNKIESKRIVIQEMSINKTSPIWKTIHE